MKPAAVLAVGGESALGSGSDAFCAGEAGEVPVSAIREDAVLRAAGLKKPFLARARIAREAGADPARTLLNRAASALAAELDNRWSDWRSRSIGLVVGTSSGGMAPLTEALALRAAGESVPRELARQTPYYGPLADLEAIFGPPRECVQVLSACASSAVAIGLGCRWLEAGLVDLVIAGGYDAVTPFVATGFESLGATSGDIPRPFRAGRDGMALGEAAVLFALTRVGATLAPPVAYIRGFGASSDAAHITAPDREGLGLVRAARAALFDANLEPHAVGLVSAHATATPFNDAAEVRALETIFGDALDRVVIHPFKAIVGHTLGASAGLELAAALDAMKRSVLPAAVGQGTIESERSLRLLSRNERGEADTCLKLSAAFGGANAAVVAALEPGSGRPVDANGVELASQGDPVTRFDPEHVARVTQIPSVHLARLDPLSGLAVAAAHSAIGRAGELPRALTGVVVGTAAATLENNEVFDRRLRERGARGAEPRRFPSTSPNLAAGQVSIAFGFLGPSLSVGAGPAAALEALLVAYDLVASGDAEAMVVIAVEDARETVNDLWAAAGWPPPVNGAVAAILKRSSSTALLDRRLLASLRAQAAEASGCAPGLGPGWPTFLSALEKIGRAAGH